MQTLSRELHFFVCVLLFVFVFVLYTKHNTGWVKKIINDSDLKTTTSVINNEKAENS